MRGLIACQVFRENQIRLIIWAKLSFFLALYLSIFLNNYFQKQYSSADDFFPTFYANKLS